MDLLGFGHPLDGPDLVPQGRRPLELELFCSTAHSAFQVSDHCVVLAFQEEYHLVYDPAVILLGGNPYTRAHTPVDVVVQAGPGIGPGDGFGA